MNPGLQDLYALDFTGRRGDRNFIYYAQFRAEGMGHDEALDKVAEKDESIHGDGLAIKALRKRREHRAEDELRAAIRRENATRKTKVRSRG